MEVATGAAGGGIPFCPGGGGSGVWFERSRAIEVFIKLPRPPLGGKSDARIRALRQVFRLGNHAPRPPPTLARRIRKLLEHPRRLTRRLKRRRLLLDLRRGQFQAIQRALAGQRLDSVALPHAASPLGSGFSALAAISGSRRNSS